MKQLTPILLLLISLTSNSQQSGYTKHRNQIDAVMNVAQAEKLVRQVIEDTDFTMTESGQLIKFWFNPHRGDDCSKLAAKLNLKTWGKADFDRNGFSDLMVMGLSGSDPIVLCIMDSGDNRFSVKYITNRVFAECAFPELGDINGQPAILYYRLRPENRNGGPHDSDIVKIDTLVFSLGDFVEYRQHPQHYKIQKIEFETTPCFGSCPVFKLTINAKRNATLEATEYNGIYGIGIKDGGHYAAVIDKNNWQLITGLMNYVDITRLNSKYQVGWTDDQSCKLTITYNNGLTKVIDDYGLIGTRGLARLYRLFFDLRYNQKWIKE